MEENKKPSNPPVHPTTWDSSYNSVMQTENGMTLRDHFAGLAMQAIISNAQSMQEITKTWNSMSKCNRIDFEDAIAKFSFAYSDAMLKQREL